MKPERKQPKVRARGGPGPDRWQSGASAIEYGLIAAFVALAIYSGAIIAGNGLGHVFLVMADHLEAAMADN